MLFTYDDPLLHYSSMDLMLRVLDQNGISQACYIVQIYQTGLEPSIYRCKYDSLIFIFKGLCIAG